MSTITPKGGWHTEATTAFPSAPAPVVHTIVVQVAARPRSVLVSLFKFLLIVFLVIPVGVITVPVGPIVLFVLFMLWLCRRDGAKRTEAVSYRVH